MSKRSQELMCKALEMAERSLSFYEKAVGDCAGGLGRDVFALLRDGEKAQLARIKDIYGALTKGEAWADACTLDEAGPGDPASAFRALADRREKAEACATELGALSTGLELVQQVIRFYEGWMDEAEDPVESRFAERMIQEERAQFIMLNDLQYYYEDPEGWARSQMKGGLDGA